MLRKGMRYTCEDKGGVMEKDVVCGMQVDPAKAAGTSQYNGKTYYFCSKGCKTKFDTNPAQYAKLEVWRCLPAQRREHRPPTAL
jgi:YHS domain-containing protein